MHHTSKAMMEKTKESKSRTARRRYVYVVRSLQTRGNIVGLRMAGPLQTPLNIGLRNLNT